MPSNHLIFCRSLLLLPSIFPSIRVFSNKSTLRMRWPKYWSFSFSISPSNEHPGPISFSMDWLDLLAVQGILKSLLQHHSSKAPILHIWLTNTIFPFKWPVIRFVFFCVCLFFVFLLANPKRKRRSQDLERKKWVKCKDAYVVIKLCPTHYDPMDCSPPGSFIHGISQARIYRGGLPFPSPGFLLIQGSNPYFLHCMCILYHLTMWTLCNYDVGAGAFWNKASF